MLLTEPGSRGEGGRGLPWGEGLEPQWLKCQFGEASRCGSRATSLISSGFYSICASCFSPIFELCTHLAAVMSLVPPRLAAISLGPSLWVGHPPDLSSNRDGTDLDVGGQRFLPKLVPEGLSDPLKAHKIQITKVRL